MRNIDVFVTLVAAFVVTVGGGGGVGAVVVVADVIDPNPIPPPFCAIAQ